MTDKLEIMKTEHEIDALLRIVTSRGPDAEAAKVQLTTLGHALVETNHDELGDVIDRIVGLDPQHGKERYDLLEAAWESVGRENDEHWV